MFGARIPNHLKFFRKPPSSGVRKAFEDARGGFLIADLAAAGAVTSGCLSFRLDLRTLGENQRRAKTEDS
jgi:hypothetical protein